MRILKKILFLLVCAVFTSLIFIPVAAADEDDIGVIIRTDYDIAGTKGGQVSLVALITNGHSEDITWVDFTIATQTPQTKRWEGTLPIFAYSSGNASVEIQLEPEDLNKDLLVSVSINFDSDANPDKVVFSSVRVDRVSDLVSITASPEPGDYETGDTLTVEYEMKNEIEYRLTDVTFQSFLLGNEDQHLVDSSVSTAPNLLSGESIHTSTTYTLAASDVGNVTGAYEAQYTFLGETYRQVSFAYSYTVYEAVNPDFTTMLSTPLTTADKDTLTDFNIEIRNTGNRGFGSFYVEDTDGALVAEAGSVGPGGTINIPVSFLFSDYGEWDVRYVVTGDYDMGEHTESTNTVHIVCEAPAASPSALPSEEPSADVSTAEPEESDAVQTPEENLIQDIADTDGSMQAEEEKGNLVLYIIIGVLGLIVLAGAVIIPIVLSKNKKKPKTGRQDNL